MCVIIYKPYNKNISLKTLKQAAKQNPDGIGVAFLYNNRWYIEKYLKPDTEKLKYIWQQIKGREAVIHCRIATSGGVNLRNCQPFLFDNNKNILFHNGIMSTLNGASSLYSDTRLLCFLLENKTLKKYQEELLDNIAGYNKFIMIKNNVVKLYGQFLEYKGLYVSNLNFIHTTKTAETKTALTYKNYNDYYFSKYNLFKDDYSHVKEG